MNEEAMLKLGKLMFALAQRCTYVRLNTETSVLHGQTYIIRGYKTKGTVTQQFVETISEPSLIGISDVNVVVDALMKVMK